MANTDAKSKGVKTPSRAASLQRMLEIERKQKMERMQQSSPVPSTGRRGASPASSSSANSKPSLLTRRRDSSLPRDESRKPHTRSQTLTPLSIHTESLSSDHLPTAELPARPSKDAAHARSASADPVTLLSKEGKKLDRDTLPSMTKALNGAPPTMRTVTFLPSDDGHDSDGSSICHSPTWDDYGKKKKDKDVEQRRKRLTKKEPPPAAMDNRPDLAFRAMSDPVLSSNTTTRPSLESFKAKSVLPLANAQTEVESVPQPRQTPSVETVDTVARSPAFIGGVRLEREREAALKRLMNTRAPSSERPVSEAIQSPPPPPTTTTNQTKTDVLKKRQTAPASPHYPPTASKTPLLAQSQPSKGHNRKRTGSLGSGLISSAAKIFQPREKESESDDLTLQRNRSRESVSSIQSLFTSAFERGRQMGEFAATAGGRTRSTEGYARNDESPSSNGKRGGIGLPPLSWKNKRRERTASMMAVPPDSARDNTFPQDESSSKLKQDHFSFLEQPFSPGLTAPLSPPASVSASLKAKLSPQLSPAPRPQSQAPKKGFKETLRAGLRSSMPPDRPRNHRSVTDSSIAGFASSRDGHPLQSNPATRPSKNNKVKGFAYDTLPSPAGQPRSGPGAKDSGASSSSSHPDSESQPSSPLTSPDTSRPQSAKDNEIFRLDDLKKALQNHSIGQATSRPVASMLPAHGPSGAGHFTSKPEAPRSTHDLRKQQSIANDVPELPPMRESNFVEDFQASQAYLSINQSWSQSKQPVDSDQLSFTSALTSLDVKRSIQDLKGLALASPNADVEPFSLEMEQTKSSQKDNIKAPKKEKHVRLNLTPGPTMHHEPQTHSSHRMNDNYNSGGSYQAYRPATNAAAAARLVSPDRGSTTTTGSSSHVRTNSPDSYNNASSSSSNSKGPSSKSSAYYLQEARKAAPASPRGPTGVASSSASASSSKASGSSQRTSSPLASPHSTGSRSFALSAPSSHKHSMSSSALATTSSSVAKTNLSSPLAASSSSTTTTTTALSSSDESKILGKPIAKMLVECCHCRFYQDMPSRVYEAMTRPDDVIKDARLGVSGQVTTCVKCPWCAHNMSTACCAGYAAVVYLKEKLHGI